MNIYPAIILESTFPTGGEGNKTEKEFNISFSINVNELYRAEQNRDNLPEKVS